MLLELKNLSAGFYSDRGFTPVLDKVSLAIAPGETAALVGESGSGKSVTALSILGLLEKDAAKVEGQILFNNEDLISCPESRLRQIRGNRIAMIFQEPMTSLNPVLRVGTQIAEAVILHQKASKEQAWAKAADLLGKVGIPHPEERVHDYPHQFSGGMRQRAMIAIALSCEPDVLIADEPTTALDVTIQAQILELMKDLQREYRMAVILITHNIGVVAEMADDVVVMYAGRPVESAAALDLFRDPRHPYTKGLLASVPSIYERKDRLAAIPGQPPDLGEGFPGCPFAPRCPVVMERCRTQDPPQFHLEGGRMANCWNAEDGSEGRRHRFETSRGGR